MWFSSLRQLWRFGGLYAEHEPKEQKKVRKR